MSCYLLQLIVLVAKLDSMPKTFLHSIGNVSNPLPFLSCQFFLWLARDALRLTGCLGKLELPPELNKLGLFLGGPIL